MTSPPDKDMRIRRRRFIADGEKKGKSVTDEIREKLVRLKVTENRLKESLERHQNLLGEKRETDQALMISERRYRNLHQSMMDGFVRIDMEGNILELNEAFSKITGYDPEDLYGRKYQDLTPKKWHRRQKSVIEEELKTRGFSDLYREEFITSSGKIIPVEVRSYILKDEEGEDEGMWAVVRDITERVDYEEKLKNREDIYRKTFENTGTATVTFGDDAVITMCNSNFEALSGYSKKEIEGKMKWTDFVEVEDLKRMRSYHEKRTEGEKAPTRYEFNFIEREGNRKHILLSLGLASDGTRVASLLDITRRKTVENRIKESEQRLDLAVRGADLGLWEYEVKTGELIINKKWAEMIGYELDEIEPHIEGWRALVHPKDLPMAEKELEKHIEGESDFYEVEYRLRCKDGSWNWILDRGKIVSWDKDGKPERMTGTHVDISQMKEARERVKKEMKRADFYLDLLGHDIGNIHQGLFMSLELAMMKVDDPEYTKNSLATSRNLVDRSLQLVNNVLLLSRIRSEERELKKMNLLDLIRSAIVNMEDKFEEKNPKINLESKVDRPELMLDSMATEIFENLISNSIKVQRDARPFVDINVDIDSENPDHIRVDVTDLGPGIPDERKADLFERYRKSDKREHTGLGLAIVKALMERYRGDIHVSDRMEGERSRGARFVLRFPMPDRNSS